MRRPVFRCKQQVAAPSVRLSAIRNNANGGIPKRALSVAKAAERKTKGATILKIWMTTFSRSERVLYFLVERRDSRVGLPSRMG